MEGWGGGAVRYFVPSIVGAGFLVLLLFLTSPLSTLESGVNAGFGVALVTWIAFALSLVVTGYLLFDMVAEKRKAEMMRMGFTKVRAGLAVIAGAAALLLYLQFGTRYFASIESGIMAGEVPLALTGITSAVWLAALAGSSVHSRPRIIQSMANGGTAAAGGIVNTNNDLPPRIPPAATQPPAQLQTAAPAPPIKLVLEGSSISLEDIKRVGTIMAANDVEALMVHGSPGIGETDRDFLQIKKNVSEWIILSLSIGGKMPKQKLESSFEDQFPKKLVPLFNSVLYDLIYQNKVQSTRDGTKMMISLP